MKSSYHIFVLLEVHPCFSAYAAVYLRQQRRGDLYEINAAKIGGSGKTGKISGYSASQGNQKAGTVNFIFDQCAVQVLDGIKILFGSPASKTKTSTDSSTDSSIFLPYLHIGGIHWNLIQYKPFCPPGFLFQSAAQLCKVFFKINRIIKFSLTANV